MHHDNGNQDDHQFLYNNQYILTDRSEESSSSDSSDEDAEISESSSEEESSESSSSESESEKSENEQDSDDSDSESVSPKVYEGCPLTVEEGVLTMMDMFVKHKMDKVQVGGVLKSFLKFLPKINNMPKTQYSLFKYVEDLCPLSPEKVHYYCSFCLFYIGEVPSNCPLCNKECHKFFQLSLSEQVRNMFENHGLAELIDKYAKEREELG